jgi:1-acyl-sn-glycerol-3-phosphate acyltransferase
VIVGPGFSLPPLDSLNRDQQLVAYTEEIMCRIAAELPESYRGIYADHPRLKQLLSEKPTVETLPPKVFG